MPGHSPRLARGGLAAAAALALLAMTTTTSLAAPTLSIAADQPGPVINRNVYAQFAEHLGTGVYGGLWVGPASPVPNTRGWRNDVVGALKALKVPLIRWPGGCFADDYHWRDGIGPREKRPVRLNTVWGGVEDSNAVGTHEFFDLVEQLGSAGYVAGNMGSGSVQEMAQWLEYLTSETRSELAELRRKNGRDKPFPVTHFGVGNEAWGCGGHMTPETYATQYRQYATFLRAPDKVRPELVASGGNDADTRWTEVLSKDIPRHQLSAISHHYYTFPSGKFEGKGQATGFGEAEWLSTLANALKMGPYLDKNLAVLDRNDPEKKIGFYIDEWGTWYDDDPALAARGMLYQQNTLRDALVAALHFNQFHGRAERVRMTNIAQMVNVLQAMVLADKDRMVLTPTYHVFRMHVPFQGATVLPSVLAGNPSYRHGQASIPALNASAARGTDGKVWLSLVNNDAHQAIELQVAAPYKAARGELLTAGAMDARNSFEAPNVVAPKAFQAIAAKPGALALALPPRSVLVVALEP